MKPNQPTQEKRCADQGEDQIVRRHVLLAVANTRTNHDRCYQTCDAGVDVDDRTAREVESAKAPDQAGDADGLVSRVRGCEFRASPHQTMWAMGRYEKVNQRTMKNRISRELGTLCDGADDKRRGNGREGQLENDESQFRDDDAARECLDDRSRIDAREE